MPLDLPTSLPAQLYLLAYNLEKDRMFPNRRLGPALRAAALTELHMDGWITDDAGCVRIVREGVPHAVGAGSGAAIPQGSPPASSTQCSPTPRGGRGRADPVVAAVFQQIAAEEPRTWERWIDTDTRAAVRETRDDLESAGWIRVAHGQVLSVLPTEAVVLLDRPAVRQMNRAAGRVLRGEVTPEAAAPDLVPLVALAAAGCVITLVSAGERRAFASRLAELTTLAGPAVCALARRRGRIGRPWTVPEG